MQNTAMSSTAAESRALEISGPQPVWMTLNEARERAFTGEIVFEVDPEVYAYLDNGVVYYAERAGEATLGRRLLEVGLVDEAQLERGTVRVGDVEHLGRLFERDVSVDRDAVLVLTELLTQDLITDLANREIAAVRACAYRHHPSGVHRWFVEPADATGPGDMAQLGHTGQMSAIPVASEEASDDELRIEWDEPLGVFEEVSRSVFTDFEVGRLEQRVDVELVESVEFRRLTHDQGPAAAADVGVPEDVAEPSAVEQPDVEQLEVEQLDVEFLPDTGDGEVVAEVDMVPADVEVREEALDDDTEIAMALDTEVETAVDVEVAGVAPADGEFQVVWPDGSATEVTESAVEVVDADESAAVTEEDGGGFRFEMPPLEFGSPAAGAVFDDELADTTGDTTADDVPDEVADAVRRALAAIETATAESASVAPMDDHIAVDDADISDHDDISDPDDVHDIHAPVVEWDSSDDLWAGQSVDVPGADTPADVPVEPSNSIPSAFAPPTPDMAAEAIYRRDAAAAPGGTQTGAPAGVASVVFVDVEDDGAGDRAGDGESDGERTSALKRLIGSLRRKDR